MKPLLLGLLLGACLTLSGCGGSDDPPSPARIPTPTNTQPPPAAAINRRKEFFYYGSGPGQTAETSDHVTMTFCPSWQTVDASIAQLRDAQLPAIMAMDDALYIGGSGDHPTFRGEDEAETLTREKLTALHDADVLRWVRVLYPLDEPGRLGADADAVSRRANAVLRKVALEFRLELPLFTCFGPGGCPAIGDYELVALDDYDAGSGILLPGGGIDQMKAQMRPDQSYALVPGVADNARPLPPDEIAQWGAYLLADWQGWAMMPWLWIDRDNVKGGAIGARSNGRGAACAAVGRSFIAFNATLKEI